MNNNSNIKKVIIALMIVLILVSGFVIKVFIDNFGITKYELKTSEYFEYGLSDAQYIIDSSDELNRFYKLYSDELHIDGNVLKDNKIFIKMESAPSGSIVKKFMSIKVSRNTVKFNIFTHRPGIGTADMACWYFVAIIPNKKVDNLSLDDWKRPSEVMKTMINYDSENDYFFTVDSERKFEISTSKWDTNVGINYIKYYQIDLDNNMISKIDEEYKTTSTKENVIYRKTIDSNYADEVYSSINEILNNDDESDRSDDNFMITSIDGINGIYNEISVNKMKELLQKIDDLDN